MAQQKIADNQRGDVFLEDKIIDLMTKTSLGFLVRPKEAEELLEAKVHIQDMQESMFPYWTKAETSKDKYLAIYISPCLNLLNNQLDEKKIDYSGLDVFHTYLLMKPLTDPNEEINSGNSWIVQVNRKSNEIYVNGNSIGYLKNIAPKNHREVIDFVFDQNYNTFNASSKSSLSIKQYNTGSCYKNIGVTFERAQKRRYINENGKVNKLFFLLNNLCLKGK
ncbi:MAG: hypothetical protein KKF44_10720 [Nanoarchaeota archaeon]|nr:hypothetical protein [Nanoarchaeota archaeon]